jgi:energy-converting hydrogenase Eha subunit H
MNIGDLKLGIINLSTLAISMSHVDMILKITLLVITIFYTLNKWWIEHKNRKNKKNK